jgi:hypothetical protein
MKKTMKKEKQKINLNPIVKNILSVLAIIFFGFILLNLAFLLDALYQGILRGIIGLITPLGPETNIKWLPLFFHGSFFIILLLISWFIFRSKLNVLFKAIFTTVPLATVYVTLGMFLYRWQILSITLGGLFTLGVLYYLYHPKKPWLYYFTLIVTAILFLIVSLLNIEI